MPLAGFGGGLALAGDIAKDWALAGRPGVAQIKTKADGTAGGQSAGESDSNAPLYAGLAVGYKFTKNMSVDLSFDSSRSEFEGEKANVRMFGVGLMFSF